MLLGKLPMSGVLLILIIVGQGPSALAAGAGGIVWTFFLPLLSISPWETARYRLKYCLEGPLSPKQSIKQSVALLSPTATLIDLVPAQGILGADSLVCLLD